MKNVILNVLILFMVISCSGGGGGGSSSSSDDSSIESLPSGTVMDITEFKTFIKNYNPFSGMSFTFRGEFSFNKENQTCTGSIDSTVSITSITSNITSSGYCEGENIKKKIQASSLQFLNIDNISEALGEDLIIEDLGSNEFRLSFKNQNNWTRSYTFKVDQVKKDIIFPVILRYNYKDRFQKLSWKISIQKGLENDTKADESPTDAIDLAESGIYRMF